MKRSLMAEKKQEEPANQSKSPTDNDLSDDTAVTLDLELQYKKGNTILSQDQLPQLE